MSEMDLLRIGIAFAGLLLIIAIFFFGRPERPPQGRRKTLAPATDAGADPSNEPVLPDAPGKEGGADGMRSDQVVQGELGLDVPGQSATVDTGRRPDVDFDKIVTLVVAARPGQVLSGEDIVVAAEKTGMVYGYQSIYHRMVEGCHEKGPVFSMASVLKPGSFDMATIGEMETPAVAFFLTLPGPLDALDAWEKMEPTAQRMAELLDATVQDDSGNTLGRQRIAHIRDELRAYDRQKAAAATAEKPARW